MLWDGKSIAYIDASQNLIDQVAGLCGTFNFKNIDDFITPEGHAESDAESFGMYTKHLFFFQIFKLF